MSEILHVSLIEADTSLPATQMANPCKAVKPCQWISNTSKICGAGVSCKTPKHFRTCHVKETKKTAKVSCGWKGCCRSVQRKNIFRHIREAHLEHGREEKVPS
ncbi:hypothetical protein V8E55_011432 [Tylopilus felleus]